jgi:hypothetical protein
VDAELSPQGVFKKGNVQAKSQDEGVAPGAFELFRQLKFVAYGIPLSLVGDVEKCAQGRPPRLRFRPAVHKDVQEQGVVGGIVHLQLAQAGPPNVLPDDVDGHMGSIGAEILAVIDRVSHGLAESGRYLFSAFGRHVHGVGKSSSAGVNQAQLGNHRAVVETIAAQFTFYVTEGGVIGFKLVVGQR